MVHAAQIAASATPTTPSRLSSRRPQNSGSFHSGRRSSTGSFHAGEPFPQLPSYNDNLSGPSQRRKTPSAIVGPDLPRLRTGRSGRIRYHTFPTPPPLGLGSLSGKEQPWYKRLLWWSKGKVGLEDGFTSPGEHDDGTRRLPSGHHIDISENPLPWTQLCLLALLSLAEQTALNSIGPYLPTMVASFPEIPDGQEGVYVGLLASAFAMAQLTTNLLWGYLSDQVGRKPTMLLGSSLLMVCFVFFGLCRTYTQLLIVHAGMGLLNGNAAIVPTCLGEITDRTNQSKAFIWLPVIYSLGSITGPALGGLLVGVVAGEDYPFLAPNIFSAALLLASVVVLAIWFEETLSTIEPVAFDNKWINKARDWSLAGWHRLKQPFSRTPSDPWESYPINAAPNNSDSDFSSQSDNAPDEDDEHQRVLDHNAPDGSGEDEEAEEPKSAFRELANRNTLFILGTYLAFQVSNISFNSLYPIFAAAAPPTGRNLGPETIGLSLSFAGLVTVLFQMLVFHRLKDRLGNLGTYRYSLLGMALAMTLMPWVGHPDSSPPLGIGSGKLWLYVELGVALVLKNISAVGGLSSVMLLITNSASSHETLGTLNGIAQSLSAAGRSVGPFLSGGLFTLSTRVRPKGEALAWGLFAGFTLFGWFASLAIRGNGLESAGWVDESEDTEEDVDEEANGEGQEQALSSL
ncbi:tetracycline:hydrogen antiporter-like protein [Thermochaetoides thermophila DSM 1495]|uniref:Tetracycline:hydrogen antiporter-like protein n=1 Tax=Chaetomium thermophilum (strain DSM 1495 / CBS 144.50 / IMI 039719) TaxID=759272 RepID=G0S0M0_CHATD|nr:tetracycline:hydrogen antiporter-like protein [Thermochaetoides thermophila DSM 1495]EGS22580.1 tetracycline:hydrogen antiporter-like protein [Thermochaetoides thermophila DSM 1495]